MPRNQKLTKVIAGRTIYDVLAQQEPVSYARATSDRSILGMWTFRFFAKSGFALLLVLPLTDVRSGPCDGDDQTQCDQAAVGCLGTTLKKHGITFYAESDTDVFLNASGGMKQGAAVFNLLKLKLELDACALTKLAPFQGTTIHAEAQYPAGTDISSYVGDLEGVDNNAAYNSVRLFELWIEKTFKGKAFAVSVKAGLLGADQEFDKIAAADFFINSSFSADLAFGGSMPIPVYPFTALGTRVESSFCNERGLKATFRSGVFDGNSAAPDLRAFPQDAPTEPSYNRHGVDFHLNPSAGLIFIDEFELDFSKSKRKGDSTNGIGRWFFGPGRFLLGGYYTTDRFGDIYEAELKRLGVKNAPHSVREFPGNYGVYLVWEPKLYEDAPRSENGLYLFARGSLLPADRNFTSVSAEAGAVYKGMFRCLGDSRDSLGVGFAYNTISRDVQNAYAVARHEGIPNTPELDFESALEVSYMFPITCHWQLQPDCQWVIHPGGSDHLHNALVLGFRSILKF